MMGSKSYSQYTFEACRNLEMYKDTRVYFNLKIDEACLGYSVQDLGESVSDTKEHS